MGRLWTSPRIGSYPRVEFPARQSSGSVAGSFAVGLFIAALPSPGIDVVLLAAIARRYEWANGVALLAALVVLNPVVKGAVYAGSVLLGTILLGPVPALHGSSGGLLVGTELVTQFLLGNAIIAAAIALLGYVLVRWGASLFVYLKHAGRRDRPGIQRPSSPPGDARKGSLPLAVSLEKLSPLRLPRAETPSLRSSTAGSTRGISRPDLLGSATSIWPWIAQRFTMDRGYEITRGPAPPPERRM